MSKVTHSFIQLLNLSSLQHRTVVVCVVTETPAKENHRRRSVMWKEATLRLGIVPRHGFPLLLRRDDLFECASDYVYDWPTTDGERRARKYFPNGVNAVGAAMDATTVRATHNQSTLIIAMARSSTVYLRIRETQRRHHARGGSNLLWGHGYGQLLLTRQLFDGSYGHGISWARAHVS